MNHRTPGIPPQREGRGPTGRRWCRGRCGGEVGRGRRSWCGEPACLEDACIRGGHTSWVRPAVEGRDDGRCALCGGWPGLADRMSLLLPRDDRTALRDAWGLTSPAGHWWEADHIVAVAEGGGGCGLDGYRTLCRPCHARESGFLRRRLNARRRRFRRRVPRREEGEP